jgi:hypothetical protein
MNARGAPCLWLGPSCPAVQGVRKACQDCEHEGLARTPAHPPRAPPGLQQANGIGPDPTPTLPYVPPRRRS